ncbi:MAG: copper chaperone PCu(A)C [Amaricoccus sp.]
MRSLFSAAAVALLATLAAPAMAHQYTLGALEIEHPYTPEPAPGAKTAAGYLSIANGGAEPDALIAVRSAVASTTLHATEIGADGVARMTALDAIEIAPGATVTLAPQGMHVMFVGLTQPLKDGDRVPATLVFRKAGEIAVEFEVQPRQAGSAMPAGMDHMQHMAPSN